MAAEKPTPKSGKVAQLNPQANQKPRPLGVTAEDLLEAGGLDKIIERAAGLGLTPIDIGHLIGISTKDVEEGYADSLRLGEAKAKFAVTNALFRNATSADSRGHTTAAIFWLKARMGWRDGNGTPDPAALAIPAGGTREPISDPEVKERFADTMQALREAIEQTSDAGE